MLRERVLGTGKEYSFVNCSPPCLSRQSATFTSFPRLGSFPLALGAQARGPHSLHSDREDVTEQGRRHALGRIPFLTDASVSAGSPAQELAEALLGRAVIVFTLFPLAVLWRPNG